MELTNADVTVGDAAKAMGWVEPEYGKDMNATMYCVICRAGRRQDMRRSLEWH